jgi:hypothetical protein
MCALGVVPVAAQESPPRIGGTPPYPRKNLSVGYEVDTRWPASENAGDRHWGEASGVAIDRSHNIWVFHRGEMPVQCFAPDGRRLRAWGEGEFTRPHQVRIDRDDNVWLVDAGAHVVQKRSPDGALLMQIGVAGESGDDSAHFDEPTDVAFLSDGRLAIADGYGNNRVVVCRADGSFVRAIGKLGVGPGEFSLPHSIVCDSHDRLYVADRNNARIQVLDDAGRPLAEWRNILVPWTLWISPNDEIYVCGSSPMRWPKLALPGMVLGVPPKDQVVVRFAPDGRVLEFFAFPLGGPTLHAPGTLNWVHAIAVGADGDLILGDIQGRRFQKFHRLSPDSDAPPTLSDTQRPDPSVRRASDESKRDR